MKILQFCKKSPVPPKDGEAIAIHQLSKAFTENDCELTVFSILTPKHNTKQESFFLENVNYQFQKVNTAISIPDIIKNTFFSKTPYIVERFESEKVKKKLKKLLKNNDFDIIQLEGIFLGIYLDTIKKYSRAKIVLRAHNVEHQIWERIAEKKSGLKKWYLNQIMIPRLKRFEDNVAKQSNILLSISSLDLNYFKQIGTKATLVNLPASYEIKNDTIPLPADFNVGFIGGLDWIPNREGIQWFLKKVWSKFSQLDTKANFNLAGRNFPRRYYDLKDSNLFVYGEVVDAQEFTLQNSIMIAPILSGSGMRIKIIEAMALGRTVLSTSVGAEGIEYTNGKNIFVADTPEEWIEILQDLSKNKDKIATTALEAKKVIAKNHNAEHLGRKLVSLYKKEIL